MSGTGLRNMQYVMSGQSTADRIAQAEQAAVDPAKKKKKKPETPEALAFTRSEGAAAARQQAIDAARAADEAEIARRGLRRP